MFSILIPTFNNVKYLELCINSIKKNSKYEHQIVVHVNIGDDGTIDYLNKINIEYSHTKYNSGICEGINKASNLAKFNYFLYAHDDFYFCPFWDEVLKKEIDLIGHNNFYLSGTMMHSGQIPFDCGVSIDDFDEKKFLDTYKDFNYYDFQGSTWAPTLVHKSIWNKVGGFSEEYFPGTGSDPDFNFKLWNEGIRIFKGLNNFKVYHFGSIVLRKKISKLEKNPKYGSLGGKIFLLKWGISIKFFKKFYLKSNTRYLGPLENPKYDFKFILSYIMSKINYFYIRLFYKKLIKINSNK
jgi:glycosyltransferase involved in cell wall biosynthesis|tara:strand:+ start:458 stop:1345 length:888 start_codon:yes stop_codon:yes gene_type:complete